MGRKYEVEVATQAYVTQTLVIEAENEEEAKEQAKIKCHDGEWVFDGVSSESEIAISRVTDYDELSRKA